MSGWLDDHRELLSVVARDLRRRGVKETGRQGLPGETVLRCALLVTSNQASVWLTLRRAGIDTPIGDNGRLMTLPAPP